MSFNNTTRAAAGCSVIACLATLSFVCNSDLDSENKLFAFVAAIPPTWLIKLVGDDDE